MAWAGWALASRHERRARLRAAFWEWRGLCELGTLFLAKARAAEGQPVRLREGRAGSQGAG
jgi:hypothetical protein